MSLSLDSTTAAAQFALQPIGSGNSGYPRARNFETQPARTIRLAEVLSALTYALDLTEGQTAGHTLRTTAIAMRMGRTLHLSSHDLNNLYYASLLKDSGCSSNAARMAALFGSDDQFVKHNMRLVDWHDRARLAWRTARNCGVGLSPLAQLRHFLTIARTPSMTHEIIAARCSRGAQIAHGLGFSDAASLAIAHVDEHWCGLGHPAGLSGMEIPVLSRIILACQTFEAFWTARGLGDALKMVARRKQSWFDPALVEILDSWKNDADWWNELSDPEELNRKVVEMEPGDEPLVATDERIDSISYAFASVIDAKTPFTYRHSTNVAAFAAVIARRMGADLAESRVVLRAGLLHDIGKLGVSNRILDKPARLTVEERAIVKHHPVWTLEILERVPAFAAFARPAALHHERMDGKGYPWGLAGEKLDTVARILTVADVFEAMTANRPYREGMHPNEALALMMRDRNSAFDSDILYAVEELSTRGVLDRVADSGESPLLLDI